MAKEQKDGVFRGWPVYLVFLILIALTIWAIVGRDEEKIVCIRPMTEEQLEEVILPTQAEKMVEPLAQETTAVNDKKVESELPAEVEIIELDAVSLRSREMELLKIVQRRGTWNPIGTSWHGKEAPDFTFTDIAGDISKLSDYRGAEVIVHYWATWCPACKTQRPDLVKLRDSVDKTRLKIIAISNENTSLLKKEARSSGINYTLTSITGRQPAPFGYVDAIPVSFFIDKQGKIKIIAQGAVSLEEMQAILRVE
jgi:peroxiredoxin